MSSAIQIVTTTEKRADAETIARTLVDRRLAACVQISSVDSVYRWQGRIESSGEFKCSIKTTSDLFERVEAAIREIHPYEVPEILALPISNGNQAYLDWLKQETSEAEG